MGTEIFKTFQPRHQQIAWFVLSLLLLLRLPFTIIIIFLLPIENQNGSAIYEVGTYLLTAFLVLWEYDNLSDFHIETSALALIIFLRPVQTLILNYWGVDSPLAFPNPFGLMLSAISIGLFIALWRKGWRLTPVSRATLGWLIVGLFAGIFVSVLENLKLFSSSLSHVHSFRIAPVLVPTSLNLLYHLSFAPINEEPLFRGFLWGYLRRRQWNETWIWLLQGGLFTIAHVYFASQYPVIFWIFIPFSGLLLGWLAWRARTIAPGMLAHALINGSVYILILGLLSFV